MYFSKLNNEHDDVITDISYDFYGKRFATCSLDKHIKVWSLSSNNKWISYDIPRAHQDSIWRLSWAHPEFGQLFASCSEDRTVCIWEEQENITQRITNDSKSTNNTSKDQWIRKATLAESKKAVNDVKFSPKHLGLKVATACGDGYVRIYEATDIFSLAYWQLQEFFRVDDPNEVLPDINEILDYSVVGNVNEHGLTCLSWNECPFENPKIAIGGNSKRAVVWTQIDNKWNEECLLGSHKDTIHDIAWAPSMGRSYHLIATASKETTFQVHKLIRKENSVLEYSSSAIVQAVNDSPVWRVTWNATGTILATSSEDGTLALWRRNFSDEWINIQTLNSTSNQFHAKNSN